MGYNLNNLVAKLKARGLDLAEESAEGVFEDVLDWLVAEAKASPNTVDDLVSNLLTVLKPQLLNLIDKIDGEDDN